MSRIALPRCAAAVACLCLLAGPAVAQECSESPGDVVLGAGTEGAPTLDLVGLAQLGLPFPRLRVAGGPPAATGVLVVGAPGAPTPLPGLGTQLYPAAPFRVFAFQLDAGGRADVTISALPALLPRQCGEVVVAQASVADATAPGGWSISAAREVRIGKAASGPLWPRQRHHVSASDAVVRDVHPDGVLDIVSCDGADTVTVLGGRADGSYVVEALIAVPGNPAGIAASDLDGDGDVDFVTRNETGLSVSVLINRGDAAFQVTTIPVPGGFTSAMVVGDIDRDAVSDILCVNQSTVSYTLNFLRGLGDGSFAPPMSADPVIGFSVRAMQADDVDGDGVPDLALSLLCTSFPGVACPDDEGSIRTLLGVGDGTFVPASEVAVPGLPVGTTVAVELALGDLDRDGALDIVAHVDTFAMNGFSRLYRYLGDGHGGWSFEGADIATASLVGPTVGDIELIDVDGDGQHDVVVADRSHDGVNVLRGNGDGTLQPWELLVEGTARPTGVRVVDLDRDTLLDVVTLHDGGFSVPPGRQRVGITRAVNEGGFEAPPPLLDAGEPFTWLASGDVDADGRPDVVTCTSGPLIDPGRIELLLGAPGGTFVPAGQWLAGSRPEDLLLQDISGDGRLDVLVVNRDSADLTLLLGEAGGGFVAAGSVAAPPEPLHVVAGEIDGDGLTDLVVSGFTSSAGPPHLWCLRGAGAGAFDAPQAIPGSAGLAVKSMALADVDADGDCDLLVASAKDVDLVLFVNDGAGGFSSQPVPAIEGQRPEQIVVVDIDGDDHLDVLATSRADFMGFVSALIVWRGLGDGSFAAPESWGAGIDSAALAVDDIDGDGLDDAILTLPDRLVSVLPGLPGGAFGQQVSYDVGDVGELVLGRFDDDAALDVLIESDNRLRLLRNTLFD